MHPPLVAFLLPPKPNTPLGWAATENNTPCVDDDDGDDDSGSGVVMTVLAAVGQQPERRGREKNASEGEWGSGLGRSEEDEHIWCSPEKSTGKVFRWPEVVAGGGAVVAGGGGGEDEWGGEK
ncbi:hypothetical protein Tco_0783141 [Tanacetum coccineum]